MLCVVVVSLPWLVLSSQLAWLVVGCLRSFVVVFVVVVCGLLVVRC